MIQIPILLIVVVVVVVVAAVWVWSAMCRAKEEKEARIVMFWEARQFLADVKERQALAAVSTRLILKEGEQAFYSEEATLYETRAVRQYQSGSTGFRLAKGVYIGGTTGRSVSTQEWTRIDSGTLTVTNKRLVFDGSGADRTVMLSKILSAESSQSGVEVSVENRQKSMVFASSNPLVLATVIRICCGVSDPTDLSKVNLQITYDEGSVPAS